MCNIMCRKEEEAGEWRMENGVEWKLEGGEGGGRGVSK